MVCHRRCWNLLGSLWSRRLIPRVHLALLSSLTPENPINPKVELFRERRWERVNWRLWFGRVRFRGSSGALSGTAVKNRGYNFVSFFFNFKRLERYLEEWNSRSWPQLTTKSKFCDGVLLDRTKKASWNADNGDISYFGASRRWCVLVGLLEFLFNGL